MTNKKSRASALERCRKKCAEYAEEAMRAKAELRRLHARLGDNHPEDLIGLIKLLEREKLELHERVKVLQARVGIYNPTALRQTGGQHDAATASLPG